MAFPAILFSTAGGGVGSASGAGPATAVTGTKARSRAASTRIGFYEASPPDLSGVAVDGSHALAVNTASGRKLTRILARKTTQQAQSGSMASGSAVVTGLSDTSAMSAGDSFLVPTAGAAGVDLYSEIQTVDSGTQVTLLDVNASGGAVSSVTCVDPVQVTVQHAFSVSADAVWAVGGKSNLYSDSQFRSDLSNYGWTADFEDTGSTYSLSTSWVLAALGGSVTDGWFTARASGAVKVPLSVSTSLDAFQVRAAHVRISGFVGDQVRDLVRVDSAAAGDLVVSSCRQGDAANLLRVTAAANGHGWRLLDCEGSILVEGAVRGLSIVGGQPQLVLADNCGAQHVRYSDARYNAVGSTAIDVGACQVPVYLEVERCVVHGVSGSGVAIHFDDLVGCRGLRVHSTLMTHLSKGLDLPSGADAVVDECSYNAYWRTTTPRTGVSAGAHDLTAAGPDDPEDPAYPDYWSYTADDPSVSPLDPRAGLNMSGAGRPVRIPVAGDYLEVAADVGLQRGEPLGGRRLLRVYDYFEDSADVEARYRWTQSADGKAVRSSSATRAAKADAPEEGPPSEGAVVAVLLARVRDGEPASAMVGREILA